MKTAALLPLAAIIGLVVAGAAIVPDSDEATTPVVTMSVVATGKVTTPGDAMPGDAMPGDVIDPAALTALQAVAAPGHSFYFTRAIYSGRRGFRGRGSWSVDFPKADRQFLFILRRLLTLLDAYEWENPVRLDDPELRRFPFLYALEVGSMDLTEPEVEGLRGYLEAGGFLVIDDFWGPRQWANFEYQISRVLPGRRIVELPLDHQIFHQFYDIDEVLQVPNVGNGRRGGPYAECYNCPPRVLAILEDDDGTVEPTDRVMVVINFNTDLGDAWEWSEDPYYPFAESTYAYELAVNFIIYAMTH